LTFYLETVSASTLSKNPYRPTRRSVETLNGAIIAAYRLLLLSGPESNGNCGQQSLALRREFRRATFPLVKGSFPMDGEYLLATAKYIEMNPVRANLTPDPYAWRWSSAKAHADGTDDILVKVSPLLQMVGDWKLVLRDSDEEEANKIRGHERTGRALGSDSFLESLELSLMRAVKRRKAG
jgi:hypothetical protein